MPPIHIVLFALAGAMAMALASRLVLVSLVGLLDPELDLLPTDIRLSALLPAAAVLIASMLLAVPVWAWLPAAAVVLAVPAREVARTGWMLHPHARH